MTKTLLMGIVFWSWELAATVAVLFSMLFWALARSLPFFDALHLSLSAHSRDENDD